MHQLIKSSVLSHIFLMGFILISGMATAQDNQIKVKLKSGLTISGELEAISQGDYVEVKTPIGKVIHLNWEEIEELDLSPEQHIIVQEIKLKTRKPDLPYNDSTFFLKASLGFPFGTDTYSDPTIGLSSTITAGKAFGQRARLGLTIGYDWYWWPNTGVIPIGLEYQTRFQKEGLSPYFYAQGGVSKLGYSEYEENFAGESKGGGFWGFGFGFTQKKQKSGAWFIQIGTKTQYTTAEYWDTVFDDFGTHSAFIKEKLAFHRMDLRFGWCFE